MKYTQYTQLAIDRLEDLYNTIQQKGIGFDIFDYIGGLNSKVTAGSILDSLPYLYPDIFTMDHNRIPRLINGGKFVDYFGITERLVRHLFQPGKQIEIINSKQLNVDLPKLEDDMENIRLTIEYLKTCYGREVNTRLV